MSIPKEPQFHPKTYSQQNHYYKSRIIIGTKSLPFNPNSPLTLFIDINSCFATVEHQYNPSLRGNPIAIAAYTGPTGTIVASSIEAKKLEIKTGMRVAEAQKIYPGFLENLSIEKTRNDDLTEAVSKGRVEFGKLIEIKS